ncbi:MAG TPA: ABC transporter permease, partial [Alphaproteobacteria bacterium]|nr:ABC transporter permease [Alphaproteobacteria bacterium]
GHAISMEIRDYPVVVYDMAQSRTSRELISRLHKPYFKIVAHLRNEDAVVRYLDQGKASLAIIIPPEFERRVNAGETAQFQILSDGTLSMSATIAGGHIATIASEFGLELLSRTSAMQAGAATALPRVDARIRVAYNANLVNAWFSAMLELFNITTMVAALLTAAAMVREKEYGTLEQLLVSPLRPAELFIAKVIPTVVIVPLLALGSLFTILQGVFDVPIRGSILLFYLVSLVYVFAAASLGLAIAVVARNVAQAMMILLLFLFPMMFLSGAFTPPESMATWMRYASLISPMRYYLDFGYQVLFKGNGIAEIWHDILGIFAVGSVMFGIAVWRFRRLIA